jgi:alkylation response protein AidB-like acyl-CoA dehydrogenase
VFESQGLNGSWSSALHDVLAASLGTDAETVVLLPFPDRDAAATSESSTINVHGLLLGARPEYRNILASTTAHEGTTQLVAVSASDVDVEQLHGLDSGVDAWAVRGKVLRTKLIAEDHDSSRQWDRALANGRWAVSHQLVGVMTTMQDLALAHALERKQFNRMIGSFQAVRHRLAETHVALEAARAAAQATRSASDGGTTPFDAHFASAMAKLIADRSATKVSAHCQQVLAGIGFTSEHPFQRFMKRAIVLERILGDSSQLSRLVGAQIAATGSAPRVIEL